MVRGKAGDAPTPPRQGPKEARSEVINDDHGAAAPGPGEQQPEPAPARPEPSQEPQGEPEPIAAQAGNGAAGPEVDLFPDIPIEINLDEAATLHESIAKAIADNILRGFAVQWWTDKLSEREQQRGLNLCADIATKVVRGAIKLVASRGFDFCQISIGDTFSIKEGPAIQGKFSIPYTTEHWALMGECGGGGSLVLVQAEIAEFMKAVNPDHPDVVGELRMPRTGPGAPSDPDAEAKVGRGPVDETGQPLVHDQQTGEIKEPVGEAETKAPESQEAAAA